MIDSLHQTITELRARANERLTELQGKLQAELVEQDLLLKQLEILQNSLKEKEEHIVFLHQEIVEQKLSIENQEHEAVRLAMLECWNNLITIGKQLEKKTDLENQRYILLKVNPELERKLEDYREFEDKHKSTLENLPAFHRQSLLTTQQKLAAELEPYFQIVAQEQDIIVSEPLSLEIVIFKKENSADYELFLPFPTEFTNDLGNIKEFMEKLKNGLLDGILNLDNQNDLTISDLNTSSRNDFMLVQLSAYYTGTDEFTTVVQQVLSKHFANTFKVQNISITCAVTEFTNLQKSPLLKNSTPPTSESPSLKVQNLRPILSEISNEETIITNTPVLTNSHSSALPANAEKNTSVFLVPSNLLVPQQTEYIRNLLIHLVAEGQIGTQTISVIDLQQSFASVSIDAFDALLGSLIETKILNAICDEGITSRVSLNSSRLIDVQDIINYDFTPFWDSILSKN